MAKTKHCFTLLETTISIAVVLLIAILAFSKLTFLDAFFLKNEIENMQCLFNHLRQKSISRNVPSSVVFDAKNHKYFCDFMGESIEYKIHHRIKFGFIPGAKGPPGNPKNSIEFPISFDEEASSAQFSSGSQENSAKIQLKKVTFFPNGRVTAGTIYLTNKKETCMRAISCSVSSFWLRKYRYVDGKWILDQA